MFIILEGPDGAGKTTFAQALAREMWEQGRGTVLINPKRSPRQHILMEYKYRLDFYKPGCGIDLILDRCWYSDDIYGPLWRGKGLEQFDRDELNEWAERKGAIVARMDADDDVLTSRLLERGDDDVDPKDIVMFAELYREQWKEWPLPAMVNPTVQQVIAFAEDRESRAPRGK